MSITREEDLALQQRRLDEKVHNLEKSLEMQRAAYTSEVTKLSRELERLNGESSVRAYLQWVRCSGRRCASNTIHAFRQSYSPCVWWRVVS